MCRVKRKLDEDYLITENVPKKRKMTKERIFSFSLAFVALVNGETVKECSTETTKDYKKIRSNIYRIPKKRQLEPPQICTSCFGDSRCSTNDCENKQLTELCPRGCKCFNTSMGGKKSKKPKLQLKLFPGKGWGVVSVDTIKPDTYISEYVGEIISVLEYKKRLNYEYADMESYYAVGINSKTVIDATLFGNVSRMFNHSHDPNLRLEKWNASGYTRIALYSKQTIQPGAEMTFDYNFKSFDGSKRDCFCFGKNCPGYF